MVKLTPIAPHSILVAPETCHLIQFVTFSPNKHTISSLNRHIEEYRQEYREKYRDMPQNIL